MCLTPFRNNIDTGTVQCSDRLPEFSIMSANDGSHGLGAVDAVSARTVNATDTPMSPPKYNSWMRVNAANIAMVGTACFSATCAGRTMIMTGSGCLKAAGRVRSSRPAASLTPYARRVGRRRRAKKDSDAYGPLTCPYRSTLRAVGMRDGKARGGARKESLIPTAL